MHIAGIIAEYNPFHNGHKWLIERARESGATHIVAVMSGNFVQRGEPALFHHAVRTKAALEGGADLVLQLPVPYAVSGAQGFARAGVEILDSFGCDSLVFGSECGSGKAVSDTAKAVYSDELKPLLADELKKGISFAAARENALRAINEEYADIIRHPNNILGVEYAAAIQRKGSRMEIRTFMRTGAGHDSAVSDGGIASASLIRERITSGGEWESFVPDRNVYGGEFADVSAVEKAMLYRMRTLSAKEIAEAPDISEGIENRIYSAARQATSVQELYDLAKTKRYSHARIRRIVLCCFLGITAEDAHTPVPYIRATGFNSKGAELLKNCRSSLPVITKAADVSALGDGAQRIFESECRAGDIYSLCFSNPKMCGEEKSLRPVIL